MSWQFQISTGRMTHNGELIGTGYSGDQQDYNNVNDITFEGQGPLPPGVYTIEPPQVPVGVLGPLALRLTPDPSNNMFGRAGFFIHGDNQDLNHTGSEGCIILNRGIRQAIVTSRDNELVVTL